MSIDKVQLFISVELPSGRMTDLQDYSNHIVSYELHYDIFKGAALFSCELDHKIDLRLSEKPLRFMWKINDRSMMTGYIDRKDLSYSKGSISQSISGRDMMSVLLDNYILTQDPYEDKTIEFILNDVYNKSSSISALEYTASSGLQKNILTSPINIPRIYFSFSTEARNQANKVGNLKHIKTHHGQNMFDFMSGLLNQAGLYMYNNPGTSEIIVHTLIPQDNNKFKSYNRESQITNSIYRFSNQTVYSNVISCSFSEDISDFHKFVRFVGQAQKDDTIKGAYLRQFDITQGQLKVDKIEGVPIETKTVTSQDIQDGYTGTTKFKVANISTVDLAVWEKTKDTLINNVLLQQNRKLYNLRYTVANHSPDGSMDPYFVNYKALVDDDFLGLSNAALLVYAVDYKGSKNAGLTTDITLCVPSSKVPGLWKKGFTS